MRPLWISVSLEQLHSRLFASPHTCTQEAHPLRPSWREGFLHEGNEFLADLTMNGRNWFPCKYFLCGQKAIQRHIFASAWYSSILSKKSLNILDSGSKHDAQDNGICSIHNLWRILPQPAYHLFQTQPIHERLYKNLHKEKGMIEFPPPIIEHFCPFFVQIAQMGPNLSRWGLILPRIPRPTPVLYSGITYPFRGLVRTQNTPKSIQNTPFSGLNLRWPKRTTVWAIWISSGQNVWKVGKTFLEVGQKNYSWKRRAEIFLWSVGSISDMITANEKYLTEWTASTIFILKWFDQAPPCKSRNLSAKLDDRREDDRHEVTSQTWDHDWHVLNPQYM